MIATSTSQHIYSLYDTTETLDFLSKSGCYGQTLVQNPKNDEEILLAFDGEILMLYNVKKKQLVKQQEGYFYSESMDHGVAAMVSQAGKMQLVVFGGHNSDGNHKGLWISTNINAFEYREAKIANANLLLSQHKMIVRTAVTPATLVLMYGMNENDTLCNEMYECDTGTWRMNTIYPESDLLVQENRYQFALAYREDADSVLLFGGQNPKHEPCSCNLMEYSFVTNEWQQYQGPTTITTCRFANAIMLDKFRLLITGMGETIFEPCAHVFNFETMQWQSYHCFTATPITGIVDHLTQYANGIARVNKHAFAMWNANGLVHFNMCAMGAAMKQFCAKNVFTDVQLW